MLRIPDTPWTVLIAIVFAHSTIAAIIVFSMCCMSHLRYKRLPKRREDPVPGRWRKFGRWLKYVCLFQQNDGYASEDINLEEMGGDGSGGGGSGGDGSAGANSAGAPNAITQPSGAANQQTNMAVPPPPNTASVTGTRPANLPAVVNGHKPETRNDGNRSYKNLGGRKVTNTSETSLNNRSGESSNEANRMSRLSTHSAGALSNGTSRRSRFTEESQAELLHGATRTPTSHESPDAHSEHASQDES
jgi:hypothetical protein